MTSNPATDPEHLHTLAALLRAWVLAAAGWLAGYDGLLPRAWRLALMAHVRAWECETRGLVIGIAVAKLPPAVRRPPGVARPPSAPPGFRHARGQGNLVRAMERGLRLTDTHGRRGSLAVRIARLRAILWRIGRHVAAMLRRIARVTDGAPLVAVAPAAAMIASVAMPAPAAADSS